MHPGRRAVAYGHERLFGRHRGNRSIRQYWPAQPKAARIAGM